MVQEPGIGKLRRFRKLVSHDSGNRAIQEARRFRKPASRDSGSSQTARFRKSSGGRGVGDDNVHHGAFRRLHDSQVHVRWDTMHGLQFPRFTNLHFPVSRLAFFQFPNPLLAYSCTWHVSTTVGPGAASSHFFAKPNIFSRFRSSRSWRRRCPTRSKTAFARQSFP